MNIKDEFLITAITSITSESLSTVARKLTDTNGWLQVFDKHKIDIDKIHNFTHRVYDECIEEMKIFKNFEDIDINILRAIHQSISDILEDVKTISDMVSILKMINMSCDEYYVNYNIINAMEENLNDAIELLMTLKQKLHRLCKQYKV